MQDPSFISPATVIYQGKEYPVVFLIDYTQGIVSFQDAPYHPSEIHTAAIADVTIVFNNQS